ncbi:MAG: hypothetical protein RBQ97_12095 [Acholeplasma sp.]|nr:hypothetical protein [Acholeplasma sp.]
MMPVYLSLLSLNRVNNQNKTNYTSVLFEHRNINSSVSSTIQHDFFTGDHSYTIYDTHDESKNTIEFLEVFNNNTLNLAMILNNFSYSFEYVPGENIDEEMFNEIRSKEDYYFGFEFFISHLSENSKLLLAYYLSSINYDFVYPFEQNFIIQLLNSDILPMQEMALQAIENWNNSSLFTKIIDVKINNLYLQNDLDILLGK